MIVLKKRQGKSSVERVNYVEFSGERQREESIAGIPMGEFRKYQENALEE